MTSRAIGSSDRRILLRRGGRDAIRSREGRRGGGRVHDQLVDPARRGMGISKAMMGAIMCHPELQDLRLWVLATADAHGLYERYGFKGIAKVERYMERRDPDVYQRLTDRGG